MWVPAKPHGGQGSWVLRLPHTLDFACGDEGHNAGGRLGDHRDGLPSMASLSASCGPGASGF